MGSRFPSNKSEKTKMALINIDALAGLNDFNRESLTERLVNAIKPLIVTNIKYKASLEDDLATVEGNDVGTASVNAKLESADNEIQMLEKIASEVTTAFEKEFGYQPYQWVRGLSIQENVKAKEKSKRIARYTNKK
tara:strand:+ start:956 stop:1363 length:408 start_codon:yes stop_codon:yes gene_type:complete